MFRRIFTFLFSLVVFVAGAAAQNLIVKKFYHAERDFTANSGSTLVLDHNNGDPCALIKVRTMQRGFTFDAGRLFPIEKTEEQGGAHPLDIYVWVQSGAKRLSIGHPQLGVLSEYDLQTTLLPGQTYILELGSGKVNVNIEEMATEQYVVFQLTPADAVVEIGGQMLKTVDGTAMKLMKFGTYQYTVKAPDYQQEVGRIEVKDPENKHIIRVQLKSDFTQMTLTAPDGAEIWVNGEKKGSGQWTGNLGAGVYKFEAKKAGHRDSQRTITLDPAAGPQTIALAAPTPILGKADISSEPALADIYIDGQKVGQTPFLASNLLVGSHSIKITRNGYADYNGTLNVKEGEKASFTASLNKVEASIIPPIRRAGPELKIEVFYGKNQTQIPISEQPKLLKLIEFLNTYPETKVTITGYADAGSGSDINSQRCSEKRAEGVARALTHADIDASRLIVDAKGNTVQPFADNDKNRVTIVVAK